MLGVAMGVAWREPPTRDARHSNECRAGVDEDVWCWGCARGARLTAAEYSGRTLRWLEKLADGGMFGKSKWVWGLWLEVDGLGEDGASNRTVIVVSGDVDTAAESAELVALPLKVKALIFEGLERSPGCPEKLRVRWEPHGRTDEDNEEQTSEGARGLCKILSLPPPTSVVVMVTMEPALMPEECVRPWVGEGKMKEGLVGLCFTSAMSV